MASRLNKRADGRYCKQLTVGIKNGKPIKKSFYGKTIKEVEKKVRDFETLREKGIILENSNLTVLELSMQFCNLKKTNAGYSSKTGYETMFHIIDKYLASLKIKDAKEYHIQTMVNEICSDGNFCKASRAVHFLNEVFRYADTLDLLYKNPCDNIQVKYKAKEKRMLTEIEMRKVNKVELSLKDRAFISTLRYTGMRRGEAFALDVADIDLVGHVINISKTVIDYKGKAILENHTKTDAGTRTVPILEPLLKSLQQYISSIQSSILFPNARGGYYSNSSIDYYWKGLRKKIGLQDDVTPHLFRHHFISECYQANVPIKLIQRWVGHSDIQTTLNIYTHLSQEIVNDGSIMDNFYCQSKISQESKSNDSLGTQCLKQGFKKISTKA